ncbi:MAG: T9SS type A sorting domain-containing protein [Candidatus Kapabacteria bacterium]|nr:T9SS type A sorting domain-containing protein [Candidatus Kapabacteria bacterium]
MQTSPFRSVAVHLFATIGLLWFTVGSTCAATEAFVPLTTTLGVGQRMTIAVVGSLDDGPVVRITFRYSPTVLRIVGSNGSGNYGLRCAPLTVIEDRVESVASAVYVVECQFSVMKTNDTLLTLVVEGVGGTDTTGFLRADKIEINGIEKLGSFNSGEIIRTGGVVAKPVVKEGVTGNYPNPFSSRTRFVYVLEAPGPVSFSIRNAQGGLVQELPTVTGTAGENYLDYELVTWQVANGAYLLQMTTDLGTYFHPMTVMK